VTAAIISLDQAPTWYYWTVHGELFTEPSLLLVLGCETAYHHADIIACDTWFRRELKKFLFRQSYPSIVF